MAACHLNLKESMLFPFGEHHQLQLSQINNQNKLFMHIAVDLKGIFFFEGVQTSSRNYKFVATPFYPSARIGLRGIAVTGVVRASVRASVRPGVRPGVSQLLVSVNFEENALSD